MKAAVLHAKDDIRYEEYKIPEIEDGEVLVRVRATGICGSDLPRVLGDGAHFFPIVLGHEFSGDVVEVGTNVTTLKVGDKVAGAPLLPCMKCEDCQRGNHSQCKHYSFIGSRQQGSFAEYVKMPEKNAVKFDQSVSYEQGALFEPSTVALHGLNCVNYKGGGDVAVLGGGNIGLFTAQWARIYGAKRVFVFDIDDNRLELAKDLGADVTINTKTEDVKEKVKEYTNGKGFAYVYETAGVNVLQQLAFELAGSKAQVCFIGTPTRDLTFTPELLEKMLRKEFILTGSWMSYSAPFPGTEWDLTAHYFKTGALRFDERLIFKKMPLSQIKEAFDMFRVPGAVKGKVLLLNY
jgi:L-iditol 2-dehydrogenase